MNILFLDIEATDLNADIGNVLCIGYKWAHEKSVHVMSIADYPGKQINDDINLLEAFEPVFSKADLVIHHFGDYYDIPFLQTRRLIKGLNPMPSVSTVDTWRIAKKRLKFGSNRLERILDVLGCPYKKTPLKLSIWASARVGIRGPLKYIIKHCKNDVLVLEWVYNRIKAIWDQHPNIQRTSLGRICSICGGHGQSRGLRATLGGQYQRLVCLKCGHSWKGPKVK